MSAIYLKTENKTGDTTSKRQTNEVLKTWDSLLKPLRFVAKFSSLNIKILNSRNQGHCS